MAYDQKCWDLAEEFLDDFGERATGDDRNELAQAIQTTIEDYLMKFDGDQDAADVDREEDEPEAPAKPLKMGRVFYSDGGPSVFTGWYYQIDMAEPVGPFPQLFPTPPELAQRVIAAADIRPGHRVLEPSAGTGALLQAMWDSEKCWGNVVAIELNPNLAEALCVRFPGVGTFCGDFLEERPEVLEGFDRICMNPPFTDGQDVRHVTHALKFLKPGGCLVAIMSAGVALRQDRATRAFRDLVEERGGTIEDLPEDAFKTAGTGGRAVLVTIDA